MKKLILTCVCFIVMLGFFPSIISAGEVTIAEGVAVIVGNNIPGARDKALDDALRKAVEQAVGTIVSSDTMAENFKVIHDKILAQTTGYVERYKILSEMQDGELYKVKVQAEVGKDNRKNGLRGP